MALADIKTNTTFTDDTAGPEKALLDVMDTDYQKSAIAKEMLDGWFADASHKIEFTFAANDASAFADTGKFNYDPGLPSNDGFHFDLDGAATVHTGSDILFHEISHALTGKLDDYTNVEYKSDISVPGNLTIDGTNNADILVGGTGADTINGVTNVEYKSDISALVNLTINGTNNADILVGGTGADTINGFGANDLLIGDGGNDSIDGGAGIDTARYSGPSASYKVSVDVGTSSITVQDKVGTDGTDTLTNVEKIQFNNFTLETAWFTKTASLPLMEIVDLMELYIASFNRAPDALGLNYWGSQLSDGMSLQDIAKSFFVQPETKALYPAGQPPQTFVTAVYNNVLDRAPDTAGLNYWIGALSSGNVSKDAFLLAILNGAWAVGGTDVECLVDKDFVGAHFAIVQGLNNAAWGRAVMAGVTSSSDTITAADAMTDGFAATAATAASSELVIPLVGVWPY